MFTPFIVWGQKSRQLRAIRANLTRSIRAYLLAGCDIFEDGLADPCADEDLTCTPGSKGYTCGKRKDVFHGLSTLFAVV